MNFPLCTSTIVRIKETRLKFLSVIAVKGLIIPFRLITLHNGHCALYNELLSSHNVIVDYLRICRLDI